MSIEKFSKKFLTEELDLPCSSKHVVQDNIIDTSRWSNIHELIFEHEGKFYETSYSEGATEMQDEQPWEHEDEVECYEVQKVERTVEVWERVDE